MTAIDLAASIIDSIRESKGREVADWAALADVLEESGAEFREVRACRLLAECSRLAARGVRLSDSLARLTGWAAAGDVAARVKAMGVMLTSLLGRTDVRKGAALSEIPAANWIEAHRRVPYVGHANVSGRQRQQIESWKAEVSYHGGDASDVVKVASLLSRAAVAMAEAQGWTAAQDA